MWRRRRDVLETSGVGDVVCANLSLLNPLPRGVTRVGAGVVEHLAVVDAVHRSRPRLASVAAVTAAAAVGVGYINAGRGGRATDVARRRALASSSSARRQRLVGVVRSTNALKTARSCVDAFLFSINLKVAK